MLCKVSDFGLSRELEEDSPVYETQVHLRCPVFHSRNIRRMGRTFRRSDFKDRSCGQALLVIG